MAGIAETERTDVQIVLESLEGLCGSLYEAVERLEKRLVSVLPPIIFTDGLEEGDEVELVPLAYEIRLKNDQLANLLRYIERIEERIQL